MTACEGTWAVAVAVCSTIVSIGQRGRMQEPLPVSRLEPWWRVAVVNIGERGMES